MCTAICYRRDASYFGRNLDLHRGYGEKVVITPRNYEINMRCEKAIRSHYSMIGMACVANNFPLYFEATNEEGLSAAGLNFPENAAYYPFAAGKDNIAPFELIPWILAQCSCIDETKDLLARASLALSPSSPFDLIIEYCIRHEKYSIIEINSILFEYDQQLLGDA